VLIGEKGNVIKTKFAEGHIMLEKSSIDAVKQWKFKPTKLKGKAVKIIGRIYLDYKKSENTNN
jgi:outer membrane biosynthesis protein TonB